MNRKTLQKGCVAVLLGYWLLAILFHWIAGAQLYFRDEKTEMMAMNAMIGELTAGAELRQPFRADADELFSVSLPLTTYGRTNTAHLSIVLEDVEGTRLGEIVLDEAMLEDGETAETYFPEPVALRKGNVIRWFSRLRTALREMAAQSGTAPVFRQPGQKSRRTYPQRTACL